MITVMMYGIIAVSSPKTANAADGGLDLWGYCGEEYPAKVGDGWVREKATSYIRGTQVYYNWACRAKVTDFRSGNNQFHMHMGYIVMDDACQWQYGPGARAYITDISSPYNWKCRY
jgi:hypothetical protein